MRCGTYLPDVFMFESVKDTSGPLSVIERGTHIFERGCEQPAETPQDMEETFLGASREGANNCRLCIARPSQLGYRSRKES